MLVSLDTHLRHNSVETCLSCMCKMAGVACVLADVRVRHAVLQQALMLSEQHGKQDTLQSLHCTLYHAKLLLAGQAAQSARTLVGEVTAELPSPQARWADPAIHASAQWAKLAKAAAQVREACEAAALKNSKQARVAFA